MKYIRYTIIFILVLVIAIPFAGSYSVQSIDELAYAIAIAFDEGDMNDLKVTFQFTMPNSSGESKSSEISPTIINSVEASSLDSAINLMNTYVSKEITLSHCKVIVISESLASKGISNLLYTLMNKVEIRPDANIIISKCLANEFIEYSQPKLENLVAKYYEIVPNSSEYTGYFVNARLGDFFTKYSSLTCEPTATLRFYQYF